MKTQLLKRLANLKKEYEEGQTVLVELQTKQENLSETLLRISGAIQVLEEELERASEPTELSNQAEETPPLGLVEN